MKLYLDSIELPLDGVYEHLRDNRLSGSKSFTDGETMPDLSELVGKTTVETVTLKKDNGTSVPLYGTYNYISDFTISYNPEATSYSISLVNRDE